MLACLALCSLGSILPLWEKSWSLDQALSLYGLTPTMGDRFLSSLPVIVKETIASLLNRQSPVDQPKEKSSIMFFSLMVSSLASYVTKPSMVSTSGKWG